MRDNLFLFLFLFCPFWKISRKEMEKEKDLLFTRRNASLHRSYQVNPSNQANQGSGKVTCPQSPGKLLARHQLFSLVAVFSPDIEAACDAPYAEDHSSPWPEHAGPGQPPPSNSRPAHPLRGSHRPRPRDLAKKRLPGRIADAAQAAFRGIEGRSLCLSLDLLDWRIPW